MTCCSVQNCFNSEKDGYQLFSFPEKDELLQNWKISMQYPSWKTNKKSRICEVLTFFQNIIGIQ